MIAPHFSIGSNEVPTLRRKIIALTNAVEVNAVEPESFTIVAKPIISFSVETVVVNEILLSVQTIFNDVQTVLLCLFLMGLLRFEVKIGAVLDGSLINAIQSTASVQSS